MPTEDNKIYNHGQKSLTVPFIIYFDLQSILPKALLCQNNPEESYTERKAEYIPSGCAWFLTCSFNLTKNKHGYFRGEDCIEMLCKRFKKLALEIINHEEKETTPLPDQEKEFSEKQKVCHICKKEFCFDENEKSEFKLYHNVRDHCHYTGKFRGAAHSIFNLRYKVPKEIPIVIHNCSAYDYHFIIKQLAEKFKGHFECLGEMMKNILLFHYQLKKNVVMVKQLHTN